MLTRKKMNRRASGFVQSLKFWKVSHGEERNSLLEVSLGDVVEQRRVEVNLAARTRDGQIRKISSDWRLP